MTVNPPLWQSDPLRWLLSFALVVGVHAGAVLAIIYWPSPEPLAQGEPMAAMVIELAPLPTAPEQPPTANPPGPEQQEVAPLPERQPKPEPVEKLEPTSEMPEVETAQAILPAEPAEPVEDVVEHEHEAQQEQQEQAPPSIEASPDEIAAAPREGAVSLTPSTATLSWQSMLLGHLEYHKQYPRESRRKRQEAVVYIRVQINRDGTVVDYRLERPSPHEPLNQESLALIARAQPLPPPPDDVTGETIEFVMPVEFSLRR